MRASGALSPGLRAVLMVGATSLFMVLVAWATLIGPSEVFTGPGVPQRTFTESQRTCVPLEVVSTHPDGTVTTERPDNPQRLPWCEDLTPPTPGDSTPSERSEPPFWLTVLVWVFVAGVGVVVLALLAYFVSILREQVRSRTRRSEPVDVDVDMLGDPARLVQAITDDAAEQDRRLQEGDPRNAIVAAWSRFEVQGRAAGVERRSWETSSEYAIRILDRVSADSGAVNRLAGLYREARFSEHPITEQHRADALEALAQVRRSLGVRA
jgi:hypothetical protein